MIISLTASHYDYENKYLLIDYMIGSCLSNSINSCYISISFNNKKEYTKYEKYIKLLQNKYKEKLKLFLHFTQLLQFQHYEFLSDKLYIDDTDRILFIDDDDLLLTKPPDYNIVPGMQYLSNIIETDFTKFYMKHEIPELIKIHKFRIVNDFSGYICTYSIFKDFFKKYTFNFDYKSDLLKKFQLNLIDCTFMTYIDDLITIQNKIEPFIFHRIWSVPERKISSWRIIFG